MCLGPRPMYSCSKRVIPSQIAASISPCVFIKKLHCTPIPPQAARALACTCLRQFPVNLAPELPNAKEEFNCFPHAERYDANRYGALAACDFEHQRTGNVPKSVTVVLSEDTLVADETR